MGDTFKAFITFVSEDSIMLGLCIAILVLIVMFILVLVLGKKKETKKEKDLDNTSELLKTEINMDALKSTTELKLDELKSDSFKESFDEENDGKVKVSEIATEIPVTTEEPVKIEIEDKPAEVLVDLNSNDNMENVEGISENEKSAYEIPTFDDLKITDTPEDEKTVNLSLENIADSLNTLNNLNIMESNVSPVLEESSEELAQVNTIEKDNSLENNNNIVESSIEPLEENDIIDNKEKVELGESPFSVDYPIIESDEEVIENNIFDNNQVDITEENKLEEKPLDIVMPVEENVVETKEDTVEESIPLEQPILEEIQTPVMEENQVEVAKEDEIELPDYSDIYSVDDIELPNINLNEFNKSPFYNSNESSDEELPKKVEETDDDLDLPKLNSNPSSTLSSLKGESFKIDK